MAALEKNYVGPVPYAETVASLLQQVDTITEKAANRAIERASRQGNVTKTAIAILKNAGKEDKAT